MFESPHRFVTIGRWRNKACACHSVETPRGVNGHCCCRGGDQTNVNPGSTFDISDDGTLLSVDARRAIIPRLGRDSRGPIRNGGRIGTVNTEGRGNTGRQARGMFISEGVAVHGYFLFLLLENIGGTKGGVGERRADGRTGVGTRTKRRLLIRGQWCLDDLCLDDTQNLPDLTSNRGDDHGNFIEEIASIARASQV